MPDIIMAETIDVSEETYKFTIDLIDINTIAFNIMNTNTGIKYNLNIAKDDEWFNENSHKIQNDFTQLYHILNDSVDNSDSEFKYILSEEKDNINFKISMKKETKFFKLDLEFNLERYISENGSTSDKVDSLEYRFNKLKDEFNKFKENNVRINNNISFDEGEYKIYNECNNLVYKGEMKNNKRDGQGIQYCPDSGQIIYSGNFKEGYYHGEGILYIAGNSNDGMIIPYHVKGTFNRGFLDGHILRYKRNEKGKTILENECSHYLGTKFGIQKSYHNGEISIYDYGNKLVVGQHNMAVTLDNISNNIPDSQNSPEQNGVTLILDGDY